MRHRSALVSISVAWAIGIALIGVLYAIFPWIDPEEPARYWVMIASPVGDALVAVSPGLAAGYLAGRRGALFGAVAGGATALTVAVMGAAVSWPSVLLAPHVTASFATNAIAAMAAALMTNGVAGLAGVHLRRLPSNNTLHADARGHRASSDATGARR